MCLRSYKLMCSSYVSMLASDDDFQCVLKLMFTEYVESVAVLLYTHHILSMPSVHKCCLVNDALE